MAEEPKVGTDVLDCEIRYGELIITTKARWQTVGDLLLYLTKRRPDAPFIVSTKKGIMSLKKM